MILIFWILWTTRPVAVVQLYEKLIELWWEFTERLMCGCIIWTSVPVYMLFILRVLSFFLIYAGNTNVVMAPTENKVDLLDALACHWSRWISTVQTKALWRFQSWREPESGSVVEVGYLACLIPYMYLLTLSFHLLEKNSFPSNLEAPGFCCARISCFS